MNEYSRVRTLILTRTVHTAVNVCLHSRVRTQWNRITALVNRYTPAGPMKRVASGGKGVMHATLLFAHTEGTSHCAVVTDISLGLFVPWETKSDDGIKRLQGFLKQPLPIQCTFIANSCPCKALWQRSIQAYLGDMSVDSSLTLAPKLTSLTGHGDAGREPVPGGSRRDDSGGRSGRRRQGLLRGVRHHDESQGGGMKRG